MSVILALVAVFVEAQISPSRSVSEVDAQLANYSPQAWLTERHSSGQIIKFRFYQRSIGDLRVARPWDWIGVRSVEGDEFQVIHTFLTSASCPSIDDAMAQFDNLTIPEWTLDAPSPDPVMEGRDLEPTPKDGIIYTAGLETYHLRGSASKIEVEFWRDPEVEMLSHFVAQLQSCWRDDPIDLRTD